MARPNSGLAIKCEILITMGTAKGLSFYADSEYIRKVKLNTIFPKLPARECLSDFQKKGEIFQKCNVILLKIEPSDLAYRRIPL